MTTDVEPIAGPLGAVLSGILTRLDSEPPEVDSAAQAAMAKREADARRMALWRAFIAERGQRYEQCRLSNFVCDKSGQSDVVAAIRAYADDLPANVANGRGVMLCGPVGTGKDHLLTGLAALAIGKHEIQVQWVNGLDLFGASRDRIDSGLGEREFVNQFVRPKVLVISDPLPPATEGGKRAALSEWQASTLLRILDARANRLKPTWVSANVASGQEATERLSAPVLDRLRDGALVCWCRWDSYRKPGKVVG